MARLRFPGRPGYRFDRIGILYGADEARQTTDPTLAIVASIHKGLQRFRDLFGDSDEDDFEFEGFSQDEVRKAEAHLKCAIETEKKLQEKHEEEQNLRAERSRATLASLAAQGLGIPKVGPSISKTRKTFNKILATGLVVESGERFRKKYNSQGINNAPNVNGVSNFKGKSVKDSQSSISKSTVGTCVNVNPTGAGRVLNGGVHQTVVTNTLFGAKTASKYLSAAKQILARATKQAVQSRNTMTHTHKVGNFILPTKSSRSSRVIKPNKRFLEDEDIQDLVPKQPKLTPLLPPSTQTQSNSSSIFSFGASDDKISTFSPFQAHGLSLSPFNMNREKGFPAFSAAPQPSGTASFTDGIGHQKPLGSLDQPLIVEGKRPRKPSLIMRMKLVEDNPEDEIKLQQQISDTLSPTKVSLEQKATPEPSSVSSTLQKYGGTKSLIAPAKLFTGSSTSLSKSLKLTKGGMQGPSQNTVVIRQPKLQLNRTALNRSKAALARSLKAQLKREAKLERKRRKHGTGITSSSSIRSPGSSLAQLSPFSKLVGDSVIEKHKSGLFEGIDGGAGSFSPGSFSSSPVVPSAVPKIKVEVKTEDYQSTLIKEEDLLKDYDVYGDMLKCLVCSKACQVKRTRKYPSLPLCKPCKKCYASKKNSGRCNMTKCAGGDGRCDVASIECSDCKYMKFRAVLNKCRVLEIPFKTMKRPVKKLTFIHMMKRRKRRRLCMEIKKEIPTPIKEEIEEVKTEPEPTTKKQRRRSDEQTSSVKSKNKAENTNSLIKQRQKHKSGDSTAASKVADLKSSKSLDSGRKESTQSNSLDKPLSVDVGAEDEPFSLSPPQTLSSTKSSPGRISKSASRKSVASLDSESKVSEDDGGDKEDVDKSRGTSRGGPRIKHVCRRAAMVFPQQRATFPEDSPQRTTLTLSALPTEEKQQLWAKTKSKCDEAAYSSTEEEREDIKPFLKLKSIKSAEELATLEAKPTEDSTEIKPPEAVGQKKRRRGKCFLALAKIAHKKKLAKEKEALCYKRKIRCRECKGCMTPECGVCIFCRDKPKFGGPGKIKKCCIHSVCKAPRIPRRRRVVSAFIEPKSPPEINWPEDDDKGGDYRPSVLNYISNRSDKPTTRFQEKRNNGSHRIDGSSDGVKDKGEDDKESDRDEQRKPWTTSSPYSGLDMDGSRQNVKTSMHPRKNFRQHGKGKYKPVEATVQVALADVRNPFMCRLPGAFHRRLGMKRREKLITSLKQNPVELKPVENETAYCFDVPLKTHLIKADFKGTNDIKSAWFHGFALTLTGTTCVRTLCYLCGSAGQQELIFCIVCCQSYHNFCLEENERPEETSCDDGEDAKSDDGHGHGGAGVLTWCCRRCQFCHVCGQQNGLLKCHRCKDTYHPECLGPNYPTRPSRKNIWVCTKCVRCKSCGATTPGVGTNATWTYDFSLCYDCGKLMDKGNFCPICHKCYSDDDWESKMVQCAICESWVHAKCEELTDEMYQLVSLLPEEVQFTCRVCSKEKPAYWESVLKSEFSNGLKNVLNALMSSKCAQLLLEAGPPREIKKPKSTTCKTSDVSMQGEDGRASGEVVSGETIPDSNGYASLFDVEQKSDTLTNACQLDEKLIEKCDCDGALIIGDGKELNKCPNGKARTNGMNGFSVHSCKVAEFKNKDGTNPDSFVINTCARRSPSANLAKPIQPCPPGSLDCDGSAQIQGEAAEVKTRVSVGNGLTVETSKQTSCDINDLKQGANPTISHVASCDSLSPRSIMSNSDSSSNTDSPMMTAKARLRESTEPNLAVSLSTFYGNPSRQSVTKNLFQSNGTDTSVSKTIPLDTNHSVDSCIENKSKRNEQVAVGVSDMDHGTQLTETSPSRVQVSSVSPQLSPTDVSPMEMSDCENHVTFEKNIWDTLDKNGEHPRDFTSIKNKIDAGGYVSVEEFSEDMVRIIQALLFENESYSTRKKQANSVRSIFVKQMERCFPWFNVNTCKLWEHNRGLPEGMLKDAVLPPSLDHNYAQWLERKDTPMTPQPSPFKKMPSLKKSNSIEDATQLWKSLEDAGQAVDTRMCLLCSMPGDDLPDLAGRLLYCGQDDWIHINCALWSAEVFESHDGSLQNVQEAVSRGKKLKCDLCQLLGATVGCCATNCRANYHFICARKDNCTFLADQTVFCKLHQNLTEGKKVDDNNFEVSRRVCVDLEKIRAKSMWGKAVDPSVLSVIIGSCTVEHLGILKSFLSDTEECLYPVDFCSTRMYWSTQDTRRRCVYTCRIVEVKPAEASELHIADMRIIHDISHPEFIPLNELGLDSLGIPNFMMKQDVIRSNPSSPLREIDTLHSGTDCDLEICRKDLHQYSTGALIPKPPKPVDLSGLSPSTLALLNIKDPQNYIPPVKSARMEILPPVQEELGLLKIAERLNNAASGKQRHCLFDRNTMYPGSFTSRMQHGGFASKSLSSSPVGFRRFGRQRSNSEERYSSPLSPLASTQAVARVNLTLPPMHQQWRSVRARSESPFTTIRCHDVTQVRSVSLSPQPRMCHFTGGAAKPNNCVDTPQSCSTLTEEDVDNLEAAGTKISPQGQDTSDEISADRINSILAQVPPEVLEENPVSVVIVSDPGDMSEEELVNITLSVLDSSTEAEEQTSADTNAISLPEKEHCDGDGVGSDQLPRGDHFTSSDVSVEEKGDKSSQQAKSKKAQEASSESGHGHQATSSGSCPIGHGGTADGSGDDDDRKPCRSGTKREASANSSDEAKAEKGKKVKSSEEDGNKTCGGTGVSLVTNNVWNESQVHNSECAVVEEQGNCTVIQQKIGLCFVDSKETNREAQQSPVAETNRHNNNSASSTDCCAKGNATVHSSPVSTSISCMPKSFTGDILSTSDEESDFLMLDDFSYSETNDEDENTKKSHKPANVNNRQEGVTEISPAATVVTQISGIKTNATDCSDVEASSPTQISTTSDSNIKIANCKIVSQARVVKPCYVALHKQVLPCAVSLKAKVGEDTLQKQSTRHDHREELTENSSTSETLNCKELKNETDGTNSDALETAPSKLTEDCDLADTVNPSDSNIIKGDQSSDEMVNSSATVSKSKLAPDCCDPAKELGSTGDGGLDIMKTKLQEPGSTAKTRTSRRLSQKEENLHERIVEKIKAESLARRSPGQEGPFKCVTCKRLYRTKESYENHVKSCDFEVSTSDEDEKPDVRQLRSSRLGASHKPCLPGDKPLLPSSPMNIPLSIIITDEFKDEKFSPSSGRELSDDCSSVQSQDSRRSSLRRSTVTQRNAAPAHLAKLKRRDSKSTLSPDGSTCSSLLSPTRCSSRMTEDKPSPKETMLEAVGLISRRSLELSPQSDVDTTGLVKLLPRISPSHMDEAPKREKRSPAQACAGGSLRPSIMAGGLPKPGSSKQKSVTISYNPVVLEEVTMSYRQKRPRPKRVWWVEASQASDEENEEDEENDEYEGSDNEEGVARRTRHRLAAEHRAAEKVKSPKINVKSNETDKAKENVIENPFIDGKDSKEVEDRLLTKSLQPDCADEEMPKKDSETHINEPEPCVNESEKYKNHTEPQREESETHKNDQEAKQNDLDTLINESKSLKSESEAHKNDQETSENDSHVVTRRAFSLRSSSSREQLMSTSTILPEQPKAPTAKSASKEKKKKTSNSSHKVGQAVLVHDGMEQLQADAITSTEDVVSPAVQMGEEVNVQADITNKSSAKEHEVCEQNNVEGGNDGPLLSPLRRSLRSSSKSAKLSEYLAELKKDEADDSLSQEALNEPEVIEKAERDCAKSTPKKFVESLKGKRGRPKGSVRKVYKEEITEASQQGKADRDTVLKKKDEDKNNWVSDISSNFEDGVSAFSDNGSAKVSELHDDKQSEMSDAIGNKSDNQIESNGNSAALIGASGTTHGSGVSSSAGFSATDVKDKDAGGLPPAAHPAIDGLKFAGQKLRFVIRSPNVDAAQKIGELIKKRALASNASSSEIIVTTLEPERHESKLKASSEAPVEHNTHADENGTAKLLPPALRRDGLCGSVAADSIGSGEVSRSVSPDSISAAYDIQSDDFSSESSNDADDYPASSQLPGNAETSKKNDSNKITSSSPEQEDDDVVIVKAVGLQPPESNMAQRTLNTVSLASNLPSGLVNSFTSNLTSGQKNVSPVLRYFTPQPTLSVHRQSISQPCYSQPPLSISPAAGQGISPFVSIQQNQLSPPRSQPRVMFSEVSPGHFILQQNQRPDLIQSQDLAQSSLLLQSAPGQSRMILQNSNQPGLVFRSSGPTGLSLQGANQSNVLFANSSSAGGLMLQQGNTPTILPGQSTLIQNNGQTCLSYISLNAQNHIRPAIISPLQSLQPYSCASLIQPNMGLAPLVQTTTLAANPPVVIGQPFFAQPGLYLPRVTTQALARQPGGLVSPKPAVRPSSIVIDPHAHMMSSSLNPALLKGCQSQPKPSNSFNPTSINQASNPSLDLRQPQNQANALPLPSSASTTSLGAPPLTLAKSTPLVARLDGAPTQVNYMGSFDLSSSTLQSVFQTQQFNKNASEQIQHLVQRALSSNCQERIPGVEVKSTITNTSEGPRKFYSVIINEDILPVQNARNNPDSSASATGQSSSGTSLTSSSQRQQVSDLSEHKTAEPNWTKILPSSSSSSSIPLLGAQHGATSNQHSPDNLWARSHSGYISIPIRPNSASHSARPTLRRALKPHIYNHNKRKSLDSVSSEEPQAKRPVFGKTLREDGTYSGTLQQVVSRNIVESSHSSGTNRSSNMDLSSQSQNTVKTILPKPQENSLAERVFPLVQHSEVAAGHPQPQLHTPKQIHQQQQTTHKRASFPIISPCKKSPAVTHPAASIIKERARKQILKKSHLKKDLASVPGRKGFKSPETEMRTNVSRRLKTTSHHPLIHHKKGNVELPQPMLEEEVVATPLDHGKDAPGGPTAATAADRMRNQSRLRFEISSDDGFSCQGATVDDAWNQVLEKVQDVRAASRVKQLSYAGISGRSMFGVDHDAVVYLIEQLYGAVYCHRNYKFKFHKYNLDQADAEVALNPSGAARSESFGTRKPFDMFNFLKSVYRKKPGDDEREKEEEMALKSSRRATSLSLPMAMRFRKLKTFAKEAVDVYRSKIHGRGLFCKRNIDAGEMVIEYAGEVIRASLTDKREKYYESRGIGCYMFRIDDDEVVDATMHGSAARFINHSCEPNCFSKVILVDGKKHIVIFAMRPIKRGEELTYDYKFPIEEVKIPCSCGSKRCRKYLN